MTMLHTAKGLNFAFRNVATLIGPIPRRVVVEKACVKCIRRWAPACERFDIMGMSCSLIVSCFTLLPVIGRSVSADITANAQKTGRRS
jgi:hypothetical protein